MIDFALSQSGDIIFKEEDSNSKQLKIDFFKSNNSVLRIGFYTENCSSEKRGTNSIKLIFNTEKRKNNKTVSMLNDDSCAIQQALIRLKTPIGELPKRSNVGSKIETVMHKNINSKSVLSEVETIVGNAIKPVIKDYRVNAVPVVSYDNGYKQSVNVEIYGNDGLLFNYEME